MNVTRTSHVWSQWNGFSQAGPALSHRNPSCHTGSTQMSDTNRLFIPRLGLILHRESRSHSPAHLGLSFLTSAVGFLGGGDLESDESFLTNKK